MAKNQNTFAKRQREMEKKAKAEAKRIRRDKRKQGLEEPPSPDPVNGDADSSDDGPRANEND